MNKVEIGGRIRKARQEQSITMEQLAERSEISTNFMGQIERGDDVPSFKTLLKIANVLELSFDYIVGDDLKHNLAVADIDYYSNQIVKNLSGMTDKQKQFVLDCVQSYKKTIE